MEGGEWLAPKSSPSKMKNPRNTLLPWENRGGLILRLPPYDTNPPLGQLIMSNQNNFVMSTYFLLPLALIILLKLIRYLCFTIDGKRKPFAS